MLRDKLKGVVGFPITPFRKEDLSIDLESLEFNVLEMIKHPFCSLVAAGGTGEMYSMTPGENIEVVRRTVAVTRVSAGAALQSEVSLLDAELTRRRQTIAELDTERAAAREVLASVGESHSAFNSVEILKANGVNAILLDLAGFHDDKAWTIDERIHNSFKGLDLDNSVIVATGYTKGTEGIMREFDRGYSEVTFSKIAVEVRPAEAVIHKEFHLSSADPNIVGLENAVIVGATNYDVADQLADVGMEAIHPKAAKPMELAGIPIRLKNTFEPEHPGTLITKDYVGERARVEMVTGSDKVTLVEIHDPSMVGTVGFDLGIMEIFCRHDISYILKATNANSIAHVLWENSVTPALIAELEARYQVVTVKNSAIVCAIGSNISIPGVLARAAQALADAQINVNCVSQTLRQVNMQFIIERSDYKKAIIALNHSLCVTPGVPVPRA